MAEEQDLIILHATLSSQKQEGEDKVTVTAIHDLIAGGIAGTASVFLGHPFDTIKVRMQQQSFSLAHSSSKSISKSTTSLFKGLSAPLVAASFINALIFGSYASMNRCLEQYSMNQNNNNNSSYSAVYRNFICGSFAGFVQCLLVCPTEHVKCRLQVASMGGTTKIGGPLEQCQGSLQMARTIVRLHGLDGIYRGFWVTTFREVPAFGAYFAGYDYMRDAINNRLESDRDSSIMPNYLKGPWAASAIAGGLSGCFTWAMVYPIDVIKTRIQTGPIDVGRDHKTRQIISVASKTFKEVGFRGLFRGLSVTLLRAFPVNG